MFYNVILILTHKPISTKLIRLSRKDTPKYTHETRIFFYCKSKEKECPTTSFVTKTLIFALKAIMNILASFFRHFNYRSRKLALFKQKINKMPVPSLYYKNYKFRGGHDVFSFVGYASTSVAEIHVSSAPFHFQARTYIHKHRDVWNTQEKKKHEM